jgi:membrane protein
MREMARIARGVRAEIRDKNLSLVAAGVAFYGLLAIFPALVAVVTVYGLVADPDRISDELASVTAAMPGGAADLITDQLRSIAAVGVGGLSFGLAISLAATVWAAAGGLRALTTGLEMIYDVRPRNGFLRRAAKSLGLTLAAMADAVVVLTLVAVFPVIVRRLGLSPAAAAVAEGVRWILLVAAVVVVLAVLYRWAPDRPTPSGRLITWGTVTAVVMWAAGSLAFSVYVGNFGRYNATYGSIAAVVVLMLWLYLSAFAVLVGAVVDALRDRRHDGAGTREGTEIKP